MIKPTYPTSSGFFVIAKVRWSKYQAIIPVGLPTFLIMCSRSSGVHCWRLQGRVSGNATTIRPNSRVLDRGLALSRRGGQQRGREMSPFQMTHTSSHKRLLDCSDHRSGKPGKTWLVDMARIVVMVGMAFRPCQVWVASIKYVRSINHPTRRHPPWLWSHPQVLDFQGATKEWQSWTKLGPSDLYLGCLRCLGYRWDRGLSREGRNSTRGVGAEITSYKIQELWFRIIIASYSIL